MEIQTSPTKRITTQAYKKRCKKVIDNLHQILSRSKDFFPRRQTSLSQSQLTEQATSWLEELLPHIPYPPKIEQNTNWSIDVIFNEPIGKIWSITINIAKNPKKPHEIKFDVCCTYTDGENETIEYQPKQKRYKKSFEKKNWECHVVWLDTVDIAYFIGLFPAEHNNKE